MQQKLDLAEHCGRKENFPGLGFHRKSHFIQKLAQGSRKSKLPAGSPGTPVRRNQVAAGLPHGVEGKAVLVRSGTMPSKLAQPSTVHDAPLSRRIGPVATSRRSCGQPRLQGVNLFGGGRHPNWPGLTAAGLVEASVRSPPRVYRWRLPTGRQARETGAGMRQPATSSYCRSSRGNRTDRGSCGPAQTLKRACRTSPPIATTVTVRSAKTQPRARKGGPAARASLLVSQPLALCSLRPERWVLALLRAGDVVENDQIEISGPGQGSLKGHCCTIQLTARTFPGQTCSRATVTGMPSAVKRLRTERQAPSVRAQPRMTRIWSSATWRSKSPDSWRWPGSFTQVVQSPRERSPGPFPGPAHISPLLRRWSPLQVRQDARPRCLAARRISFRARRRRRGRRACRRRHQRCSNRWCIRWQLGCYRGDLLIRANLRQELRQHPSPVRPNRWRAAARKLFQLVVFGGLLMLPG